MWSELIQWLESNLSTCMYNKHLGMDCFGCGMQRAFVALLKGDISESVSLYPALIPMLVLLFFLLIHLKLKIKKGSFFLKFLFLFCVGIIIISYLYKITTLKI